MRDLLGQKIDDTFDTREFVVIFERCCRIRAGYR